MTDDTQKVDITKDQGDAAPASPDASQGGPTASDAAPAPLSETPADAGMAQPQTSGGASKDKTLTCRDCGNEFVWTAGEQEFYAQKGFNNPPSRCRICRGKYKAAREQFGRVESKIICKNCGKETTVPFVPRDPSSVLCRECFQAARASA